MNLLLFSCVKGCPTSALLGYRRFGDTLEGASFDCARLVIMIGITTFTSFQISCVVNSLLCVSVILVIEDATSCRRYLVGYMELILVIDSKIVLRLLVDGDHSCGLQLGLCSEVH